MRARPYLFATVVIAAAAVGATAACSLTTSLNGLSNGPEDAAVSDSATSGDRTAPMSPESGTADAADSGDGDGGDAMPVQPFRCSDHTTALFCADFDVGALDVGFTNSLLANGGTVASGTGRFGRGLAATVPARGGTTNPTRPSAALRTGVSLAARAPFTLAYDMKIEGTLSGGGVVDFGAIVFEGNFYIVGFRSQDDGAIYLHEYGNPTGGQPQVLDDLPLTMKPPAGAWVHVAAHMTFPTTTSAHLVVEVDGATAYDGPVAASPYAAQPTIYCGISNAENAAQMAKTIEFDDVLVTSP